MVVTPEVSSPLEISTFKNASIKLILLDKLFASRITILPDTTGNKIVSKMFNSWNIELTSRVTPPDIISNLRIVL